MLVYETVFGDVGSVEDEKTCMHIAVMRYIVLGEAGNELQGSLGQEVGLGV